MFLTEGDTFSNAQTGKYLTILEADHTDGLFKMHFNTCESVWVGEHYIREAISQYGLSYSGWTRKINKPEEPNMFGTGVTLLVGAAKILAEKRRETKDWADEVKAMEDKLPSQHFYKRRLAAAYYRESDDLTLIVVKATDKLVTYKLLLDDGEHSETTTTVDEFLNSIARGTWTVKEEQEDSMGIEEGQVYRSGNDVIEVLRVQCGRVKYIKNNALIIVSDREFSNNVEYHNWKLQEEEENKTLAEVAADNVKERVYWEPAKFDPIVSRHYADIAENEPENSGGSVDYYKAQVHNPTTPDLHHKGEVWVECNDIIEVLNMTYAEANIFKETWRTAAARTLGKQKAGHDAVRGAEKIDFFAKRNLIQKKGEQDDS